MRVKSFITGLVSGIVLAVGVCVGAELVIYENPYKILVNGKECHIEGYNINDRSYFQLRDIAEATKNLSIGFENEVIIINTIEKEQTITPEMDDTSNIDEENERVLPYTGDVPDTIEVKGGLELEILPSTIFDKEPKFWINIHTIINYMESLGLYGYDIFGNALRHPIEPVLEGVVQEGAFVDPEYWNNVMYPFVQELAAQKNQE